MNYCVCSFLLVLCIVQAFYAWRNGAFWGGQRRKCNLSFLKNVTISFSDMFVLPVIAGLVYPYLVFKWWWLGILVIAIIATYFFHKGWWPGNQEESKLFHDHIFEYMSHSKGEKNQWLKDMTVAGWLHVVYMIILIVIVVAFVVTSMPDKVVIYCYWLLILYIISQAVVCVIKKFQIIDVMSIIFQVIAVHVITAVKINLI